MRGAVNCRYMHAYRDCGGVLDGDTYAGTVCDSMRHGQCRAGDTLRQGSMW